MDTTLDTALRLFTQRNVEALPVIEGRDAEANGKKIPVTTNRSKVIGLLSRRDLISTYHQKLHDIQSASPTETNESHVFQDALTTEESPAEPSHDTSRLADKR